MNRIVEFDKPIRRLKRAKQLLVLMALKLSKADFSKDRPMVAIVGDHIGDCVRAEGLYERKSLEILKDWILASERFRELVAIDVGANIGNHTIAIADQFAQVIAFEPNPLARRLLEINLDMNGIENVQVRPYGLSNKRQRTPLHFDEANLGAATTIGVSPSTSTIVEIELNVGDDEIPEATPVGFIKVDVEGAEEYVLHGLQKTIGQHRPVLLVEQLADVIDAHGTSPCFDLLTNMGYVAFDIGGDRTWKGRLAALAALVLGRERYRLRPITRLDKRDYLSLAFLPAEDLDNLSAAKVVQ
jgi:FkbM family methyltransferase